MSSEAAVDAAEEAARILRLPNLLREKAVAGQGRRVDDLALKRAHAAILLARDRFLIWADAEVTALDDMIEGLPAPPLARSELRRIADAALELRSSGTTNGYPLISAFAASLKAFCEELDSAEAMHVDVMRHHVMALRTLIRDRIDGNGGELGAEVSATLVAVVAKLIKSRNPR